MTYGSENDMSFHRATAAGVLPEPVLNGFRRLMRDDRALRPDSPERAGYRDRLDQDTHREESA